MMFLAAMALALGTPATEPNPIDEEEEFYPAEFRGSWAPTLEACKAKYGEEIITVGRTKIWSYEADSKLLKITPVFFFTGPKGVDAKSVHAMVAERGETEVGIGKLRLTLAEGKLYTSRIDAVTEDQQWKYGNVKCP